MSTNVLNKLRPIFIKNFSVVNLKQKQRQLYPYLVVVQTKANKQKHVPTLIKSLLLCLNSPLISKPVPRLFTAYKLCKQIALVTM